MEEIPGYDAWKGMTDRDYPYDDEEPESDSPFCECDLEPIEDEDASNECFACGKPLR